MVIASRKVLIILLIFSIAWQHCLQLSIYTWYTFQKQAITYSFCINKANKALHCNGKCYLGKQLQKSEENQQQQSHSILKTKYEYSLAQAYNFNLQPQALSTAKRYILIKWQLPPNPFIAIDAPSG
ncbi:MAG: hypothetical protein U0T72_05110 [Chitinophagales bacterium]